MSEASLPDVLALKLRKSDGLGRVHAPMRALILTTLTALAICGAAQADGGVWRLYRNSAIEGAPPIRIATFDADDENYVSDENFNRSNCEMTRDLWRAHNSQFPYMKYWCVKEAE